MANKVPAIEKMEQFIINQPLNFKIIADKIGISAGTFSEKLNKTRGSKFTKDQTEAMWKYLKQMAAEINKL